MKKLLALTLSLAAIGFTASSTEAKAASANSSATISAANTGAPQLRVRIGRGRRNNRRAHVVTQTRLVRFGRQTFRETYQITYLPNGGTRTRVISRVRVR